LAASTVVVFRLPSRPALADLAAIRPRRDRSRRGTLIGKPEGGIRLHDARPQGGNAKEQRRDETNQDQACRSPE